MIKKICYVFVAAVAAAAICSCSSAKKTGENELPKVYFTSEISPESLVKIYKALGVKAKGNVAVKISSGEGDNGYNLKPELIGQLVDMLDGTIVECNAAYKGNRHNSEVHWKTMQTRGYFPRFKVDLLDEEGSIDIPVRDTTLVKFHRVGSHIDKYDFMVNLAHFKGHKRGGFGGVIKNASIGIASAEGKAYIHSWGNTLDLKDMWNYGYGQDYFLESMAASAQAVHDYFAAKRGSVYIDVMNNMSVDCDCHGTQRPPEVKDMGIMASLDPVAVDQACVDMVFNHTPSEGDDQTALIERINSLHGLHTLDYADSLGLGSKKYQLICID